MGDSAPGTVEVSHCSASYVARNRFQCGAFAAASMITAATSFGFESIGTWLVFNSVVVAFTRFAKNRSSSGAIAPSSLDTMYHDGFVFHATVDTLVARPKHSPAPGWT